MILPYASRTGTRRNLDALRAAGWRLVVVAGADLRSEGFPYGLDNGAWGCFQRGEEFNSEAFRRAVAKLGAGADWVVMPDIVAGGLASLRFSMSWASELQGVGRRRLIAVQNGMTPADVRDELGDKCGLFVGGTTEWKWDTVERWASLAHARGAYCHVGRVNTTRRIRQCIRAGVDSFDGTSVTRFAVNLPKLDASRKQTALPFDLRDYVDGCAHD